MASTDRNVILGVVIAAVLSSNLLAPWMYFSLASTDGEIYLVVMTMGYTVAQMGLLASWCALGNQTTLVRVPACCGLLLIGCGLFLLGWKLQVPYLRLEGIAITMLYALSIFIGIQLPLWGVRYGLRRRIGLRSETQCEQNSGQFSIRYLLIATTIIAVIMSLISAASPAGELGGSATVWLVALAGTGIFSVFAATLCLPGIWIMLSERRSSHISAALAMGLAWLGGPIVLLMILTAVSGGMGDFDMVLPILYVFGMSTSCTTLGGLLLLRGLDYRLLVADRGGNLEVESDANDWSKSKTD